MPGPDQEMVNAFGVDIQAFRRIHPRPRPWGLIQIGVVGIRMHPALATTVEFKCPAKSARIGQSIWKINTHSKLPYIQAKVCGM
jgi:hypothetical protein